MGVYISAHDKGNYVNALSAELRNDIMIAVENKLNSMGLKGDEYQKAWGDALNSKVSELEGVIDIEYVDEKLTFYVVENLRYQQDKAGSFKLERFDRLEDAVKAYVELPKEYTSAIGASLTGGKFGIGELDLVHRKNGETVQVNDFKYSERWNNPLVRRAVTDINRKLGVEYEADMRLFGGKTVLVPLQPWGEAELNSYFMDKYLLPTKDAEAEVARRYGSLDNYSPNHPNRTLYLLSSINEVFIAGKGWIDGKTFFTELNAIDEYSSPKRLKVTNLNINYVDINGREGQADIQPAQFGLLKMQTVERTARHPDLDAQIEVANKVRAEQMANKKKSKSKDKEIEEDIR